MPDKPTTLLLDYSRDDLDALARTLYGEARGEGLDGMRAVAHVVLNRLALARSFASRAKQYGDTVAAICRKRWQFSCWNPGDPNLPKLQALDLDADGPATDRAWLRCLYVAAEAMAGDSHDPTKGATHYFDRRITTWPHWATGRVPCATIGNHIFFNNVD